MTPATIIEKAQADGITLELSPAGNIMATGEHAAVRRWLAVLRDHKAEIIDVLQVGARDTVTASRWWLMHYPDRDPVKVVCSHDATHGEMLERYPDVVAAEPSAPTFRQPSASMTAAEKQAIRAWLALIEETDPTTIAEVVDQCEQNAETRDYFIGRAVKELPKPDSSDDRRTCEQCMNLVGRRCLAAQRGEIMASRNYEPIRDMLQRCEGYVPRVEDSDRQHGREHRHEMIEKEGK
jgi:hypothetical protein